MPIPIQAATMHWPVSIFLLVMLILTPLSAEPLTSWNEPVRSRLLEFIQRIADPTSPDYRKPEDRLAAFDLDGTLWPEKPMQFMRSYASNRIRSELPNHPEWRDQEPFQSALENKTEVVGSLPHAQLDQLLLAPYAGKSPESREWAVKEWMNTTGHPRWDRPYRELFYRPQLELISYLQERDFKVVIVSASEQAFVRGVAPYCHVEREHAIGSLVDLSHDVNGFRAIPRYLLVTAGQNKPIALEYFLGRQAVIAVGNSDGDIGLLQETKRRGGLSLLIHHTDKSREYEYDRKAERALKEASREKWLMVDMKRDWKSVF